MKSLTCERTIRHMACLTLSAISIVLPSCAGTPAPPGPNVTVRIVNPEGPVCEVDNAQKPVHAGELVDFLISRQSALGAGQKLNVTIQAPGTMHYESVARAIRDCRAAQVQNLTFEGTPVPPDWELGEHVPGSRVSVTLRAVGLNGQRVEGDENALVAINLDGEEFYPKGVNLAESEEAIEGRFRDVEAKIRQWYSKGLSHDLPFTISPTPDCHHRWVRRAVAAVAGSGCTSIYLTEPVSDKPRGIDLLSILGQRRSPRKADREENSRLEASSAPQFFGVPLGDPPRKIVFVLDRSGSMTDSIDFVKYQLKRCVGELAQNDQFDVLFYSSGPPPEGPGRGLVPATERNKQLAFEFIDGVVAQGETDPAEALRRAFAAGPETILLLTDGEFDPQVARLVKDLNKDGKVKVHTIAFLYDGHDVLRQIAAENGGVFKFVSEADLADMAKGGVR